MNGRTGPKAGSPLRPQDTPVQYPNARLGDAALLAQLEPIYEHVCWLVDVAAVDFGPFAGLSLAIRELRERRDAA